MSLPGWIVLNRSLADWEWYDDANTMRVFVHCLLKANYEPKRWRGMEIGRGELATSVDSLSTDLKLSPQQIRTSLKKLKSTNEITIKATNKLSLISITNYKKYQDNNGQSNNQNNNQINNQNNKQITNEITTKQQSNNNNITNKQINNKTNLNTSCSDFGDLALSAVKKKPSRPAKLDFSAWPEKPSDEIWAQYKKIRQAKRAPVTQVLVDAMGEELAKLDPVDWTVEKALRVAIASGWQGFKAQWLINKQEYRVGTTKGGLARDGPGSTREMSLEDELSDRSWASS